MGFVIPQLIGQATHLPVICQKALTDKYIVRGDGKQQLEILPYLPASLCSI